jgi:hypothetical protein
MGLRKDFWTGAIYVGVGVAALLIARNYSFGSGARMGPGYFPTVVSTALILVGLAVVGRSFFTRGERVTEFAWGPLAILLASLVAFGFLLTRAGFLVAAVALVLGCAFASERFRLAPIPLLGMVVLIGLCAGLFIYGLGIPMPLIGPWFGGQAQ